MKTKTTMNYPSVQQNQSGIIYTISQLHLQPECRIQLDPCFNRGLMYGAVNKLPVLKSDIAPCSELISQADCRDLPYPSKSIKSIIFDPPFLVGFNCSIMVDRYSSFRTTNEMLEFFKSSLNEFARIIQTDGTLIVKIQDCVHNRRRVFSSHYIRSYAFSIGFKLVDEIIQYTRNRIVSSSHKGNSITRSHHCFFMVFKKRKHRSR